jgi:hypothetical protein
MRRVHPGARASIDLERHLPSLGPQRWTARNKAAVVLAIRNGTLRLGEAYDHYMLSEEELSRWEAAFDQDGLAGLQVKRGS